MKWPSHRTGRYAGLAAFALVGVAIVAPAAGIRVNTTPSIPIGLYQTTDETIAVGDYVMFCPPEREVFRLARERHYLDPGACPGGSYPMVKRILAAKNDQVRIGHDGVFINGQIVPHSLPRPHDGAGRPLPRFSAEGRISDGDVIVMGENPVSFDSRYFGPIPRRQITSVIRPIVTWGGIS